MTDTPGNNWGPFGIISVLIGIISWLFGGCYLLQLECSLLDFLASRSIKDYLKQE